MGSWVMIVIGVVLAALGTLWALQGVGLVGGSVMSSDPTWLAIGVVVDVVAVVVIVWGLRARRS